MRFLTCKERRQLNDTLATLIEADGAGAEAIVRDVLKKYLVGWDRLPVEFPHGAGPDAMIDAIEEMLIIEERSEVAFAALHVSSLTGDDLKN